MNVRKAVNELLVVGGLVAALASGASAISAQALPSGTLQQVSGKILSIDPVNRFLKLQAEKSAVTGLITAPMGFTLSAETVITEGARKLQPSDLQAGAVVQVEYKVEGGRQIAQSIAVQQPAASATQAKPEEAPSSSPATQQPQAPAAPYR